MRLCISQKQLLFYKKIQFLLGLISLCAIANAQEGPNVAESEVVRVTCPVSSANRAWSGEITMTTGSEDRVYLNLRPTKATEGLEPMIHVQAFGSPQPFSLSRLVQQLEFQRVEFAVRYPRLAFEKDHHAIDIIYMGGSFYAYPNLAGVENMYSRLRPELKNFELTEPVKCTQVK